jgi:hypothetical protein
MKFINGWKYVKKDSNRFHFGLRISVLTVYEVFIDVSDRAWKVVILNFGVGNK